MAAFEKFHREITKPQLRLKEDRQSLLQPVWGYDATSARSALGVKPGERRLDGQQASVQDRLRGLRRTGSAPLDRARGSVNKSSPNRDQAMYHAIVVRATAFQP